MARRPYLGENSRYDPAALTRARVAELLSELRAHCAALKGGAAQADTPYAVWEALERLGRWGEAAAALKSALVAEGYGPSAERPRLALSEVALVVIDCSTPRLAAEAMRLSLAQCAFGDAILFTDTAVTVPGVRVVPIPRIASESEYSRFVLKELAGRVEAEYALVAQWDGFVLDAARWSDEFLLYDYVGAPWPQHADGHDVGNGGFSLRSRRLLRALLDPEVQVAHPEDAAICRTHRDLLEQRHGVSFAPTEVAAAFSHELDIGRTDTFGFHGMFHLPRVLAQPRLRAFAFLDPLIERWQDEAS